MLWVDASFTLHWNRREGIYKKIEVSVERRAGCRPEKCSAGEVQAGSFHWDGGSAEPPAHLAVGISMSRRAKGWNYAPRKHLARVGKKCSAIIKRHNKND